MAPTLEMIVAQDRPAHNRQIGVRPDIVMWELLYKIKQFPEGGLVDLHRHMLAVEQNAVLVVINVGRVLEKPTASVDRQRNQAVILPCRMVDSSGIAFIFLAELAERIACLRSVSRSGYSLWVFLWLGEIDRDLQRAVFPFIKPLHVPFNPITPDIVGVLAESIIPVCCSSW